MGKLSHPGTFDARLGVLLEALGASEECWLAAANAAQDALFASLPDHLTDAVRALNGTAYKGPLPTAPAHRATLLSCPACRTLTLRRCPAT